DFNTPRAIAVLFDLARETNEAIESNKTEKLPELRNMWDALAGDVLGLLPTEGTQTSTDKTAELMELIIQWRKEAREKKDFAKSDEIRKALEARGIIVEDGKSGATWKVMN